MQYGAICTAFAGLLGVFAGPADAQSAFVGAGGGVSAFRFSHQRSEGPTVSNNDISDNSPSWSVTAGGRVARRAVLQVEYSGASELKRDIAPTSFNPPCTTCGTTNTTVRYRGRQLGVLAGFTSDPSRRVSIVALGGMVFGAQRFHVRLVSTPGNPSLPRPLPSETESTQYLLGPEFGADVPIAVTRQIRVVPQARIYRLGSFSSFFGNTHVLVTTAGVQARWYF